MNQEKKLSNCIMIMLKLDLKPCAKQNREQDLIYELLNKCFKDEFELPDGWYSISDIQDYFEYILKKHRENIDNPSITIYITKPKIESPLKLKQDIILNF